MPNDKKESDIDDGIDNKVFEPSPCLDADLLKWVWRDTKMIFKREKKWHSLLCKHIGGHMRDQTAKESD